MTVKSTISLVSLLLRSQLELTAVQYMYSFQLLSSTLIKEAIHKDESWWI